MTKAVVGVRFKKVGKIYYFDPKDLEIEQYDHVIVETARGIEYGEVALAPREIDESELNAPIKPVIRKVTERDVADFERLKKKETEARGIFTSKVKAHKLEMKLIDVEYTFDKKKAIFYFTAEGRVDFRDLVKDLASVFKVRIELRQIGVRDEAKLFKGLGVCGRTTCCAQWLGDFTPVSIKMAKEQNLSLNSTKISGICGRLLCCLTYEEEFYEEISRKMPRIGHRVTTPDGDGDVFKLSILEETVFVKITLDNDETEVRKYPLEVIQKKEQPRRDFPKREQRSDGKENVSQKEQQSQDESKKIAARRKNDRRRDRRPEKGKKPLNTETEHRENKTDGGSED